MVAVEAKDTKSDKIHRKKCNIHRRNLLSACVSFNFFIRKYTDMLFDEDFGVGTYFGSGEETDFIWEYFSTDDSGVFAENTFVYHPYGNLDSQKRYKYGLGNGAIYKKEICGRKHYMMFFNFCYSLFRSIVGMFFLKQREPHYAALKGKIKGFLEYQIQK